MWFLRIIALVLLVGFTMSAQNELPKGKIIDSVAVVDSQNESYALYLPNSFSNDRLSSIVFIFDPSGNGKNGLHNFISSADQFNHILVCSNNAKNGPMGQNFDIANRLFNSVLSKFNIDPNLIYLAGFSGGSRFATAIAVATGKMRAVIACGAGFPDDMRFVPTEPSFIYAGIVGDRDMNLIEMFNNKPYLNALKIENELFIFDGPHRWPPEETIQNAFLWVHMQDYKDKMVKIEPSELKMLYEESYKVYKGEVQSANKLNILNRMDRNFRPYFNTDSLRNKMKVLKQSEEFIKNAKIQTLIFKTEEELIVKLTDRFLEDYENPTSVNERWWIKEIDKLNKLALKSEPYGKSVERLKYKMYEMANVRSNPVYFPVTPEQKKFCEFVIAELIKKSEN